MDIHRPTEHIIYFFLFQSPQTDILLKMTGPRRRTLYIAVQKMGLVWAKTKWPLDFVQKNKLYIWDAAEKTLQCVTVTIALRPFEHTHFCKLRGPVALHTDLYSNTCLAKVSVLFTSGGLWLRHRRLWQKTKQKQQKEITLGGVLWQIWPRFVIFGVTKGTLNHSLATAAV